QSNFAIRFPLRSPHFTITNARLRCIRCIQPRSLHMSSSQTGIISTMQEHRLFPPSPEFSKKTWIQSKAQYDQLYRESIDQPDKFWGRIADELHWFKKWDKVLDWQLPYAKWFTGAKTNLSHNCLDAQV